MFLISPFPPTVLSTKLNDHMLENNASHLLIVLLQFIPMPVLYGVFLYMGASSLKGIQVNYFTLTSVSVVT